MGSIVKKIKKTVKKVAKKISKPITKIVKKEGFLDLSVDWIRKDSPFSSINNEIVMEINPKSKTFFFCS